MNEMDRPVWGNKINWTRKFGTDKKIKTSSGEFIRYVKGGKKVVIILDNSLIPLNVPIGEVALNILEGN